MKLLIEQDGETWTATEFRCGELSVSQVIQADAEQGVKPEHVGKWRVSAGATPRERVYFPDPESAMFAALTLERLESEGAA